MFFLNILCESFQNKYLIIAERILNLLIFAIDLVINRYAMVGRDQLIRTWISPAPWAFSIWGIYKYYN